MARERNALSSHHQQIAPAKDLDFLGGRGF